jgi:hypothetical protein
VVNDIAYVFGGYSTKMLTHIPASQWRTSEVFYNDMFAFNGVTEEWSSVWFTNDKWIEHRGGHSSVEMDGSIFIL